jgi:DNA primase
LKDRGVTGETAKQFRIGFAKDEWQLLNDHLKASGFSDLDILKSGLVVKNEKGKVYDRFRGRVVFPIFNEKGEAIAFSARILTDTKDQPKYINSPETPIFSKSQTLYGLNFAKQTIRKHDFVILMEGQMDVILSHQMGYTNAVASSGTSFTEDQLKILKRHTNNLLISFDGDTAGINSSKKVWELAILNDMDVKVIALSEGEDPADVILKDPKKWKDLVKNSKHIIEYFSDHIIGLSDDKRKQQKLLQAEIYPYLRKLKSYTDKSYFVELIGDKFGIEKDAIWADINTEEKIEQRIENKEYKQDYLRTDEILYGVYLIGKTNEKYLEKLKEYISEDRINEIKNNKEKIMFETESIITEFSDLKKMIREYSTSLIISKLEEDKSKFKNDGELNKLTEITRKIEDVKKNGCTEFDDVV